MDEIKRLRKMRAELIFKARKILDDADAASRELTAEEDQQFQVMHDEAEKIRQKIEELERVAAQRRSDRQAAAESMLEQPVTHGMGGGAITGAPMTPGSGFGSSLLSPENANRAILAWCRKQYGMPLDDSDQYACTLYRQYVDPKFTPESRDLVVKLSNNFQWRAKQQRMRAMHPSLRIQNALSTSGAPDAGATVPDGFVSRLETALLAFGGMLQVADVMVTDSGNDMPWPTANDTTNKGTLLSEATTIGSSVDPAFASVILQAYKYSSKLVQVSAEIIEDSAFDLPSILGAMLGERLGRILNEHFTTGTGTAQPNGIVTAAAIGVTAASATAITADELIDLQHSVDPAYRRNASFMLHDSIIAALRKLKDTDGQYLWQPGLQEGVPDRLLGQTVHINQDMTDTMAINADVLLYGDLSKYKVRLAGQVRNRRLVERYADTDQEGFVSFLRADGDLLDAGTEPVKKLRMAAA